MDRPWYNSCSVNVYYIFIYYYEIISQTLSSYGIKSLPLAWLRLYLPDREQSLEGL